MIAQLATILPTAKATHSTESAIRRALAGGRVLRQYQIADRIGLTEHHDWSTHAVLNSMADRGDLTVEHLRIITRTGELSKKTYRHFSLTQQPRPMRRRDILADWAGALGFRF
jgi:hypothetical protein